MNKIKLFARLFLYLFFGGVALICIFFYQESILVNPIKYKFHWYHVYLYINLIILPFFRLRNNYLFIFTNDMIESPKKRAMDLYHQDMNNHHGNRKWSTKGTGINPYEYTSNYTLSYNEPPSLLVNFVKSFFMSLIFIVLSPIIYIYSVKYLKNKK